MAFKKVNINETMRNTVLVLLAFPLIVSANIDCGGKAFHCVNSTHFMICVDLGSGVSSTIDDFVIPCPPSTACHKTNYYECEFPLSTTLAPTSASSVASKVITISEGTVSQAIPELATEAIFTETDIVNAGTLNAQSVTDNHLFASIVESTTLAVDAFTTEYVAIDNKLNSDLTVQGEVISNTVTTETILLSTTNVNVPSTSNNTFTDNVINVTTDSFPIDISERTETVNLGNVITQTNKVLAKSTTVMSTSFAPELNKSISTVVAIGPDITTTNDSYLVSTTTEYFADTSLLISDVTIDKTTIDTFTTESSLIYTTDSKVSVTNMHKAYFNETTHKFSTEANVSDHMTYNTSAIESVIMPTDGTTYDTTETNANTQGHRMTANELPTIQNVSTINEIETTSIAIETISEVTDPFIIDTKIQDYSTKINEVTQGVLSSTDSLIKVSPTLTIEKNLSSTQTKISNSNQSTNELEHKIHTIPPTLTTLPESTIASHTQNILIDVIPKISKQTTPKPNHVITETTTLNIDTLAEGLLYSQTEQTSINENNFIPSRNMLTGANLDVSTTTSFPPPISTELPLYGIQETITGSNFLVSASEPNVNSNFEVLSTAANPTQSTFSAITDATSADVSVPLSITQTVTDATFYVIPTSDPEFLKEVQINYTDGISTDNIISTADSQTTVETYDIHKETINQSSTPKYTTKISVDSPPSRQVLIKKNETINKTISLDTTTEGSPSIIGGTETISGVLKTDNQITLGQSPEMRTTTFDADMVTQTPLQIDGTLINLKKPISFNIATTEVNYEIQPSISSFGTITEGANFSQVSIEPNNKIQTTTSDLKTLTQSTSFSESQQIANSKVSTKSNYETTTPLLKTKTPLFDINTDSSTVSVTLNQAESELNFGIKTSTSNLETDAQGVILTQTEPVSIDTKIAVSIYDTVTEINKSNKTLNLSETITTVANLSKIEGIDNGNFVDASHATSDQNYVVQTTLPNPVIIIEGKPTFKQEEQSNVNISLSSTKTITESYFEISTSAFTSGMLAERKPLAEVVIDKVTITEPSHTIVATESIFETTTKGLTEDISGIIPLTSTEAITKQNKETVKVPLTNIHSITYDPTETSVQSITESNYKIQPNTFNEISEKTLTDDGTSFSTSIPMTTNQVISQIIHFENQTPTRILQPITEKSQLSQVHKTINESNANVNIQKIKPTITTSSTLKSTNMETSVLHNKNTNKSTFNQQESSIGIQNNLVTIKVNKTDLNSIRTTELSSAIHNTTPKVIEKSSLSDKVNKERSFTDSQFGQISQALLPTMTGENRNLNNAVIRNEGFGTDITELTTIDETGNIKATKNDSATVGKTTHIVKGIVENPTENKVTRLEGIPTVTTKQVNVQNTDTKFVTDAYLSGSIKSISASTYNQQAETTEPLTTNESHPIQTNDKNVKIEGIDNVRTDFEVTNKTFNSSVTESLNLNDNTRISGTPLSSSTVVYKDTYKKATPKTHSKINFTDENTNFNSTSNGSTLESQAIIPNIGNITIHPREKIVEQTVSLNEMNEHVTSVHTNVSSNNSNAHRINAGQPGISYSPQPETTLNRQQRLSNIEHSNNNLKTIAHKLDVIETSTLIAQLVNNEMLRQPVQVNFKNQINPKISLVEYTDSPKISERDSNGRVQSKVQHKIITPYLSTTEKAITSQWPSLNKSKTIREVPIVVQRVNVASNLSIVQSTNTTLGAIPDQPNQNKTKQINRTLASHTGNKVRNSLSLYCRNRSRGRYSDHNDCTKFYICIGRDQPIVGNCPANTVFSDLNKQCTKNKAHCIRNNEFKCVSEGRFSDILKQNVYYICVKGMNTYVRFEFRCQNGYHLDKATVKCTKEELPKQSASSDKSKREDEEEKTSSVSNKSGEMRKEHNKTEKRSKLKSKQEFECTEEGKFVDPNNCKKYYVCTKNKKSEFRRKRKGCDSDELFNNEKKKCVDKDSYEC